MAEFESQQPDSLQERYIVKRLITIVFATALLIGFNIPAANASTTDLPVVNGPTVSCDGIPGYFQAWFRKDNASGARSNYRGGFRTLNNQWVVSGIYSKSYIGIPGGAGSYSGGTQAWI